jgi:hypothetical protein
MDLMAGAIRPVTTKAQSLLFTRSPNVGCLVAV